MNPSELTYVVQGPVFASTATLIRTLIANNPEVAIVVSTWIGQPLSELREVMNVSPKVTIVESECPAPLECGEERWFANVNRMIVSTRRGLEAVATPFAMKLRSDTVVNSLRLPHCSSVSTEPLLCHDFVSAYEHAEQQGRRDHVVMCWSLSHHPFFPYYISDWFHFGRIEHLLTLWSIPLATQLDASYFASRTMVKGLFARFGQYTSSAFHARFHSEQYLCLKYLEAMGEVIDFEHRNDWSICRLADSYGSLFQRFIVVDRSSIPFTLPTHPVRPRSGSLMLFQASGAITSRWMRCIFLMGAYLVYASVRICRAVWQRINFRAVKQ